MAEPREISRQERILSEAQQKLERIERMREEMAHQVELEMQRLEKMREVQENFTQSPSAQPSLSNAAPSSFQSQFDQFSATKSNERLKPIGNEGVIDFYEKLHAPKDNTPFYRTNDRDEHWQSLTENPGKQVYASGRYVSSEHGNQVINSMKEYEYEVTEQALPISVGDIVTVQAHPRGHNTGKMQKSSYLKLKITDIYSKEKFHPYHDSING